MLLIGAGGFAKENIDLLKRIYSDNEIVLYDDVTHLPGKELSKNFKTLRSETEAKNYFEQNNRKFVLAIGGGILREKFYKKFEALGGEILSVISPISSISKLDVEIGLGANIMDFAVVSSGVKIGKAPIIYFHSAICHDSIIGDFVEISPGAKILGGVIIGDYCSIGSGSIILPNRRIGNGVVIAAGAVVTKDIPDNCMVAGVPAEIKKKLES